MLLSPAYDVCYAYQPDHSWVSQHTHGINGKRTNINKEDILTISRSFNIKNAEQTIMQINDTVNKWKRYADEAEVEPILHNNIAGTLIFLK